MILLQYSRVWSILSMFTREDIVEDLSGNRIHHLENIVSMQNPFYHFFNMLYLWLKPVEVCYYLFLFCVSSYWPLGCTTQVSCVCASWLTEIWYKPTPPWTCDFLHSHSPTSSPLQVLGTTCTLLWGGMDVWGYRLHHWDWTEDGWWTLGVGIIICYSTLTWNYLFVSLPLDYNILATMGCCDKWHLGYNQYTYDDFMALSPCFLSVSRLWYGTGIRVSQGISTFKLVCTHLWFLKYTPSPNYERTVQFSPSHLEFPLERQKPPSTKDVVVHHTRWVRPAASRPLNAFPILWMRRSTGRTCRLRSTS